MLKGVNKFYIFMCFYKKNYIKLLKLLMKSMSLKLNINKIIQYQFVLINNLLYIMLYHKINMLIIYNVNFYKEWLD